MSVEIKHDLKHFFFFTYLQLWNVTLETINIGTSNWWDVLLKNKIINVFKTI